MGQAWDVIVLGLGGFGSATCAHLASRGARVLGLEQFSLLHDRGSSHGETRMIRKAYFEHPDYVPLLQRGYELWRELESQTGQSLLRTTGLLLSGMVDGVAVSGAIQAARQHQLDWELLTPEQVAARHPGIRLPESHAVVFEPDAGYLHVEACVAAHLELAQRAGAVLRPETPVRKVVIHPDSVELQLDSETICAGRLVVTAGAWTSGLMKQLGVSLRVVRKFAGWFEVAPGAYHVDAGYPCFYIEEQDRGFYGFPSLNGLELKLAEHSGGIPIEQPADVDRSCHEDDVRPLQKVLQATFPLATTRLSRHSTCLYTLSPDHHFIVDRLPEAPHVTLGAGFSGHGFKFTSVLGQALAELCLDGVASLPIDFLSLRRFAPAN